ncbi:hypothetical protein ACI78V_12720 [Geodermatophilus sp. SYSU D00742]
MTSSNGTPWGPPCPVCGAPHDEPAWSGSCGVPADGTAPPSSPWQAATDALLVTGLLAVLVSAIAVVTMLLGAGPPSAGGLGPEPRVGVASVVVAAVALVAGQVTRSALVCPLLTLLAAQPALVLLVSTCAGTAAGLLAGLLGAVLLDVAVLARGRRVLASVAEVLMRLGVALTVALGPVLAWSGSTTDSWTTTALLTTAGAVAPLLRREPRLAAHLPGTAVLLAGAAVLVALSLPASVLHIR